MPRRVLIVEDEDTLRRVVARNLIGRGLEVDEAGSAQAALQAVTRTRPDLLLLDINLPDRTGWDVLRELRRRDTELPTIVISAVRANPDRVAEFHPLAYLPKPFPLDALLRLVLGAAPDSDGPLRVAASMLSRAPTHEMTATTVVSVLGRDDLEQFRALVGDIADEYDLAATITVTLGSFSVRFQR